MGASDSYQNSLAVIENNKTVSKSNKKMLDKMLELKRHEINKIAEVEKKKIEAQTEKQRIQREICGFGAFTLCFAIGGNTLILTVGKMVEDMFGLVTKTA